MTPKILVIGELNVDLILNDIKAFPQMGKEIIADEMDMCLGSSSAIMAANIAAMGVDTSFCGVVGDDYFGDFILGELEQRAVDCRHVTRLAGQKTGCTFLMNYGQDRANVTFQGVMNELTIKNIPFETPAIYQHLHISSLFLQRGLLKDIMQIFINARAAGMTTSLDLQWDPAEQWAFDYAGCLPYVDVFMPNESELLALTKTDSIHKAIEKIRPYLNTLALKMGKNGSMGISGSQQLTISAFEGPHFVDAIGAGDSFNAGFIQQYISGEPLEACLRKGNLMGALNTTAAGGTGAFCDFNTISENIKKIWGIELSRS